MTSVGFVGRDAQQVPAGDDWLSAPERAAQSRLAVEKRRRDWRLGRHTAKEAVRAWYGAGRLAVPDPAAIEIRAADDGAPEVLVDGVPAAVTVSITHRDGHGVAAIAERGVALGCDLETIESRRDVFAEDWFTADEVAAIDARSASRRDLAVTRLWAAKEAALKALREGLRVDTRRMEVEDDPDEEPACGTWRGVAVTSRAGPAPRSFAGWWTRLERDDLAQVLVIVADPPADRPQRLE